MNQKTLVITILVGAFLIWRLYQRFKSHTGPQEFHPGRIGVRTFFFGVVFAWVAYATFRSAVPPLWILVGAAGGLALGWLGQRLTRFDFDATPRRYTPNLYLGSSVTLLWAGRLVYTFGTTYSLMQTGGARSMQFFGRSPLTSTLSLITFAFYISYNILVIVKFNSSGEPPKLDQA